MPNIQILSPHLADLIAAGEVVERPASVAKELMENAIDAGATKITVEIERGGMTYLRVTDNGGGIPAAELSTAFLRHATSKLRTQRDLESIGTLGFRGEALAAISAVSRIEIMSRQPDSDLGASLSLEGGTPGEIEEAGCPIGTTMIVRDLFYNTPARLKFVKKDASEGAAVAAAVQRTALSHPEVAVTFIRDGKNEMQTPGDGQLKSALYAVMGRNIALGFISVCGSGEGISVTGFTSLPTCCRGSRSYQHFFVNGRYVKSRTMMAAVEEAYRNQKMVGRFPGCAIHLTIGHGAVDVNVHPAKIEVKFHNEREIFSAVYHAVQSALEGDFSRPVISPEVGKPHVGAAIGRPPVAEKSNFSSVGADSIRPPSPVEPPKPAQTEFTLHDFHHKSEEQLDSPVVPKIPKIWGEIENKVPVAPRPITTAQPSTSTPTAVGTSPYKGEAGDAPLSRLSTTAPPEEGSHLHPPKGGGALQGRWGLASPFKGRCQGEALTEGSSPAPVEIPWRVQGEILNTYIIVEQGDTVLLIDKHAAHERMNFDRMKSEGYSPMMQTLLVPLSLRMPPDELAILLEHLSLLEDFGFQAEDFGGSLLVRQIPFDVDVGEVEEVLSSLSQTILVTGTADPTAARDHLLHSMACKAAIKGGWNTSREELQRVAEVVMSGQVKYCPHGRPVAVEMTKYQIEKMFKRA